MIRRTRGISRPEPEPRGHTVPLRADTPEECEAARRYVASRGIDAAALHLLLDALGLHEEDPHA